MPLFPGAKLGPYKIVEAIGDGGMGEVYRARDTRLGRDVAIKVLPQHLSSNSELKERFDREARAISSLNHERICTLHDESLAERLRKEPRSLKESLKIGIEVCEALDVAHRAGIVHRDLKPGNIMLTKSGVKLMDFGLAKASVGNAAGSGKAPLLSATVTIRGPSPMSPLTSAVALDDGPKPGIPKRKRALCSTRPRLACRLRSSRFPLRGRWAVRTGNCGVPQASSTGPDLGIFA